MRKVKFVRLEARPETTRDLLDVLAASEKAAASEPGTLQWQILRDPHREHVIHLYELYEDDAAVEAHDGSEAVAALVGALPQLTAIDPEVLVFDVQGS